MRPHFLLGLGAVALIAACREPSTDTSTEWRGEMTRLGSGAVLVRNPSGGYWPSPDRWQLRPRLRVGELEGNGATVFGRIGALAVDGSGAVIVFDAIARELRAFDTTGKLVARAGRRGQGPTDFEEVIGIVASESGKLWVVDGGLARYSRLDADDLSLIATFRRPSTVYHTPWAGGPARGDGLYDAIVLPAEQQEAILRIDSVAKAVDTMRLAAPPIAIPTMGSLTFPLPYAERVIRHVATGGVVWVTTSHDYRLTKLAPAGDTLLVVTRDLEIPGLSSTERDSVERYARRLESQFGIRPSRSMIPSARPIIAWLTVDDRDYLWVGRLIDGKVREIDVFDDRGRFAGVVDVPVDLVTFVSPVIRSGFFTAAIYGESGAPAFVRAAVVPTSRVTGP